MLLALCVIMNLLIEYLQDNMHNDIISQNYF